MGPAVQGHTESGRARIGTTSSGGGISGLAPTDPEFQPLVLPGFQAPLTTYSWASTSNFRPHPRDKDTAEDGLIGKDSQVWSLE